MNKNLKKWTLLATRQEEIYHICAKKTGLPDAQFWILYAICSANFVLSQNNFCQIWRYSKQTTNAAVTSLRKMGLIYLDYTPGSKKEKGIYLTDQGQDFCNKYIRSVSKVEEYVLNEIPKKDMENFFRIYENILCGLAKNFKV